MIKSKYQTIIEALEANAQWKIEKSTRSRAPKYIFPQRNGEEVRLGYDEVLTLAERYAWDLDAKGVVAGDRIPLVIPTGPEYLGAFFGCMIIGAIPCPMPLPSGLGAVQSYLGKFQQLADYLGVTAAVTNEMYCHLIGHVISMDRTVITEDLTEKRIGHRVQIQSTDIAFIQCTSGTTGTPKGVILTHGNLLANAEQLRIALALGEKETGISWLPLNHDMGLIGGIIFPMYLGCDEVLMDPRTFLRRPASWLKAISKYEGTISAAPNFAYNYTRARVKDQDLNGLDLSSWRRALCGAEPIDSRTLNHFEERFESVGFQRNVFVPCYGLAEASLAVSFHEVGTSFILDHVDRDKLVTEGLVQDVSVWEKDDPGIVSCGPVVPGTEISIVDENGVALPEGQVGRVLVSGPSVSPGYWELPELTAKTIQNGWLDTGDLGYLRGDRLRITGRDKDIIIIRGKCYSPSEFEWAAESVDNVRPGRVAAFGSFNAEAGTEQLHLMLESSLDSEEHCDLRNKVIAAVTRRTGVAPSVVHVRKRHTVPMTTSGKIQRSKAKLIALEMRVV
ncbi:MAG: fatty acyl-AMP ligase [Myxococcota bacterium]|nr:fatty acyl-AMP ligase [Myxococcota bacterium]